MDSTQRKYHVEYHFTHHEKFETFGTCRRNRMFRNFKDRIIVVKAAVAERVPFLRTRTEIGVADRAVVSCHRSLHFRFDCLGLFDSVFEYLLNGVVRKEGEEEL